MTQYELENFRLKVRVMHLELLVEQLIRLAGGLLPGGEAFPAKIADSLQSIAEGQAIAHEHPEQEAMLRTERQELLDDLTTRLRQDLRGRRG